MLVVGPSLNIKKISLKSIRYKDRIGLKNNLTGLIIPWSLVRVQAGPPVKSMT
jgi:hypothetical protein